MGGECSGEVSIKMPDDTEYRIQDGRKKVKRKE
jgi:hypothetical protein